jgi:trans-aconitate methyltransferase
MSYLDSEEASVLYRTKANIIMIHDLKSIVDVGCRTGEVNKYLEGYDYEYYGFDTSEEPIQLAKSKYPNKLFEVRDWSDLRKPFETDVVIFGSVLIYENDPIEFFERVCSFYSPKYVIIHEVNNTNKEELKYTDLDYFSNKYPTSKFDFNLNISVGKRTILVVQYQ